MGRRGVITRRGNRGAAGDVKTPAEPPKTEGRSSPVTTLHATPEPLDPTGDICHLTHVLLGALGIQTILTADIPPSDLGRWESTTSTLFMRADTTTEQQTWLIVQLIEFLGVDRQSGAGRCEPVLTVVPPL